ncbi:hypothetical protein KRP22_011262 [Phytophthora ramorum]|nr:hypothetical protein KRP22_15274 [Phytophthora ramorum]
MLKLSFCRSSTERGSKAIGLSRRPIGKSIQPPQTAGRSTRRPKLEFQNARKRHDAHFKEEMNTFPVAGSEGNPQV